MAVVEMQLESFSWSVPLDKKLGYEVNFYDLQDTAIPF